MCKTLSFLVLVSCSVLSAADYVLLQKATNVAAPAAEEARPNYTEWQAEQKALKNAEANATAKESKMGAIQGTVKMLADLQTALLAEGDKESWTYNKFACFCKDTMADKATAIKEGTDSKESLAADIGKLETDRDALDTKMKALEVDIAKIKDDVNKSKTTRDTELELYQTNAADLSAALEALVGAINSLKAAKEAPSLMQLQKVRDTVKEYTLMADALGMSASAQRATAFLEQAPEVQTENYKFKSGDVIETLEGLQTKFRTEKETVDSSEADAVATHELFLQKKHDENEAKETELEDAKASHAQKMEQISSSSDQLTTVSATLLDDQQYLEELAATCNRKAVTWDSRTKVRAEELSALTAALDILKGFVADKGLAGPTRFVQRGVSVHIAEALAKSEDGMEAIEAGTESEESPASFLQQRFRRSAVLAVKPIASAEGARHAVIDMLRGKGRNMKSAVLMNLVSQLSDDKFAKVKLLITELIDRLKKEAANEATQKAWCDKSQSDAETKRDSAAEAIRELNSDMARLEALRDKLVQELDVLAKEIADIKSAQEESTKIRDAEKTENTNNVKDAKEGAKAVQDATDVLNKYYSTQEKAVISLSQRSPDDDAPGAGFDDDETYKGATGAATGIIGMLEVIISDFERTVQETELAEQNAEQDHLAFMVESGKSMKEKETAETEKKTQKDDAVDKLGTAQTSLETETGLLATGIKELLELKEVCNVQMTYEERVERRNDEIAQLKRAMCIFDAYQQYGPDGIATNC